MKQKFLLAAMAITVMASCSNDETTDVVASKAIGFGVVKGNSVETRVTKELNQNTKLGVFAFNNGTPYQSITNMELAYTGGKWVLPAPKYYPGDNSEVFFWAYGPRDDQRLNSTAACDAGQGPTFTLTLTDATKDVDLLVTKTAKKGKQSAPDDIVFALERVMAKVKFEAYTLDNTTYTSKIKSIIVKAKGTSDYANGAWGVPTGDVEWTALGVETEIAKLGTSRADAEAVPGAVSLNLIPKDQNAEIVITAGIYNAAGDAEWNEVTRTITLDGSANYPYWQQGKVYTYVIKIDPANAAGGTTVISFGQPTEEDWTDGMPSVEAPIGVQKIEDITLNQALVDKFVAKYPGVHPFDQEGSDHLFNLATYNRTTNALTGTMVTEVQKAQNNAPINYAQLRTYCEDLREKGYSNWRIPTAIEAFAIYEIARGNNESAVDSDEETNIFGKGLYGTITTSTQTTGSDCFALIISNGGSKNSNSTDSDEMLSTRCVRNTQP